MLRIFTTASPRLNGYFLLKLVCIDWSLVIIVEMFVLFAHYHMANLPSSIFLSSDPLFQSSGACDLFLDISLQIL
ncbi:hypothetical protein Plhal703r1_c13g0066121 [Plasmopara halstedii]